MVTKNGEFKLQEKNNLRDTIVSSHKLESQI